jgi:hypothetical protein
MEVSIGVLDGDDRLLWSAAAAMRRYLAAR